MYLSLTVALVLPVARPPSHVVCGGAALDYCSRSGGTIPFSEVFSRGMRFRTDMLFNGSICGAQRDKNGDPDFGAPCAFDAVREDLARRPLRGVPDGRPFLEARRDLARRR